MYSEVIYGYCSVVYRTVSIFVWINRLMDINILHMILGLFRSARKPFLKPIKSERKSITLFIQIK